MNAVVSQRNGIIKQAHTSMSIDAITIDFWNTLVDSTGGPARRAARNAAIREAFDDIGAEFDEAAVREAFEVSYAEFERRWYGEQRTMDASACMQVMWEHLGVRMPEKQHRRVTEAVEDSILAGMPALLPGVEQVLPRLAQRFRLALISDTAMSPGRVLRQVLERHGVASYFRGMVFSDVTGVSKPHPLAYATALRLVEADAARAVHIGDIERTDIAGAVDAGMRAVLFRGDPTGRYHGEQQSENTRAHAVAHDWFEIESIINDWDADGASATMTKGQEA